MSRHLLMVTFMTYSRERVRVWRVPSRKKGGRRRRSCRTHETKGLPNFRNAGSPTEPPQILRSQRYMDLPLYVPLPSLVPRRCPQPHCEETQISRYQYSVTGAVGLIVHPKKVFVPQEASPAAPPTIRTVSYTSKCVHSRLRISPRCRCRDLRQQYRRWPFFSLARLISTEVKGEADRRKGDRQENHAPFRTSVRRMSGAASRNV